MSVSGSGKKLSAFAVFKGKKAGSLTDIDKVHTPRNRANKSSSADSTPCTSNTSLGSKLSSGSSLKKKAKLDAKKIKKLIKSASKGNHPPVMLDSLGSPLLTSLPNGSNNSSVTLKSLRPKGSMSSISYQLPLKALPVTSTLGSTPRPAIKSSKRVSAVDVSDIGQGDSTAELLSPACRWQTEGATVPDGVAGRPPKGARLADIESDSTRAVKRRRRLSPLSGSSTSSPQLRAKAEVPLQRSRSCASSPRERKDTATLHPAPSSGPYMFDSHSEATSLFECLIHPVKPKKFFTELWEKKPLLVKRHMPSYNDGWFSTAELDRIMRKENLIYGENIDVVTYVDGKRETHNIEGRAFAPIVWDYYQNGCSVRLLNPHTYCSSVWKLLSILQEYFGCYVGANVYLTPPGTQGFAPHWDDIEAFILQLEGKKHWRLYSPRSEAETLPRYSSDNFTDSDFGESILDVILEAGDMLYFPRGIIHQGKTLDDTHSLHITVSCCQKNSWADLLEKMVPRALQVAFEEDIEFRKALPIDYLNYMGVAFSDVNSPARTSFLKTVEQLTMKLLSYMPVDASCDQLSKQYIHDSLPPVLTEAEKQCSIHGNGERWNTEMGRVTGAVHLGPETNIKIVRKGVLRLVTEEKVCIYHNLENARVYHGRPLQQFEIDAEWAPAVEYLLHAYPNFVSIEDLPVDDLNAQMDVATLLYEKGLLITREPLKPLELQDDDAL